MRASYSCGIGLEATDLGLEISGTGVRNDFTAADVAVRKAGVQRIKTWIEVAAKLGAPVIRAFADSQPPPFEIGIKRPAIGTVMW